MPVLHHVLRVLLEHMLQQQALHHAQVVLLVRILVLQDLPVAHHVR